MGAELFPYKCLLWDVIEPEPMCPQMVFFFYWVRREVPTLTVMVIDTRPRIGSELYCL